MSLGSKIKELRIEKGLSQLKLAQDLGLAQSSICNWETEKQEPSIVAANKIAKYFNVSLEYLLSDDEPKTHFFPAVARSADNTVGKHMYEMTEDEFQTIMKLIERNKKTNGQ